MKNSIKKDISIILSLVIFVIIIFNFTLLHLVKSERNTLYGKSEVNYARVKVKPAMDMLRDIIMGNGDINKLQSELKKENAGLLAVSNKSDVFFSYRVPEAVSKVSDENIYADNSFMANNKNIYKIAFPIEISENQIGNAVFYLNSNEIYNDKEKYSGDILIVLSLEVIILILLFCRLISVLRKKVFSPIKNLQKAADRINKGDYNFEITHTKGEVGKFAGAFELMRDEINENSKIQKKMDESRKNLIAAISHDIRTPVATISAYVEAINSGVANNEEKLKKYLDIIYKKCGEIKKLTEDLFTHSQIDAEKLSINKEEIYFGDFIKSLLEPVIIEAKNKGIDFSIETTVPNAIVNIDVRRMGQVFLNIIQNSIKYRKEKSAIKIYFFEKENEVEIEIKDNGIGIKPEDMPYIFDKFYRGEKSRNKAYGGAGLGLSICKSIVEAHGGEIWIESIDGTETKVFFTIHKQA